MSQTLAGRAIALVGIVTGLLAIGLNLVGSGGGAAHYADHGAVIAFVIALLAYASYLPAEVGLDTPATVAGTVAFGFFLYVPASLGFNQLGSVGAAGWLGLCTLLIPVGAHLVRSAEPGHGTEAAPLRTADSFKDPLLGLAVLGIVLIVIAVWLPDLSGGPSVWNAAASGHALGLLILIVAVVDLIVVVGPLAGVAVPRYTALLIVGASFGLVLAPFVHDAFNRMGSLGNGGWLLGVGGLLLFGGVVVGPRIVARLAPAALAR
jgi:hypothetical protein